MRRSIDDLRFAIRGFRRTPGFFAILVMILGNGIGASVAMSTVFTTVLLRKLPVLDQDGAAVTWRHGAGPDHQLQSGG